MRTIQSDVIKAVTAVDRAYFDALLTADVKQLDDLLGADFLIVDVEAGRVTDRADFLDLVASQAVRFTRIEPVLDEAIVRQFTDTVVIVGRTRMAFSTPDGVRTASSRYTHIFSRADDIDGTWQLVSAQGTPTADQS